MANFRDLIIRWTATFETKVRQEANPDGTFDSPYGDLAGEVDIPENEQTKYQSNTYEVENIYITEVVNSFCSVITSAARYENGTRPPCHTIVAVEVPTGHCSKHGDYIKDVEGRSLP